MISGSFLTEGNNNMDLHEILCLLCDLFNCDKTNLITCLLYFSWPKCSALQILISGCMMMDLMRRKVKITLKGIYGERFFRYHEYWIFVDWCEFETLADDFESKFYTVAIWFLVGRHPLVSFVHYSHCLYHLVINMGQTKILQHLQVGQSLNIWNREEFRNFCYLAWRDLELAPSSSRYASF